jgi:hypothetical protein
LPRIEQETTNFRFLVDFGCHGVRDLQSELEKHFFFDSWPDFVDCIVQEVLHALGHVGVFDVFLDLRSKLLKQAQNDLFHFRANPLVQFFFLLSETVPELEVELVELILQFFLHIP